MASYFLRADIQSTVAPVLNIQRIPSEPPTGSFDMAVYLSQHTAWCVGDKAITAKRHLAIGATTCQALSQIGISSELPERANSDGVLSTIAATLKPGSSVLILCGEDGMSTLRKRLVSLNYKVCTWCVYRRVLASKRPRLNRDCGVVELSSVTAMQAYCRAVRRHALSSTQEPNLVVPSRRIGKYCRLFGFTKVHVAADATPRSIAQVIKRLNDDD